MKNKFKWPLLAIIALIATVAVAADKYISSSGNIVLKTATSKSVNLQDTLYTTQAGKVGIGLSNPTFPFMIREANGMALQYSSSSIGATVLQPLSDGGGMRILTDSGLPTTSPAFIVRTHNSGYADRFAILGNGNVGVGINNPTARLYVAHTGSDTSALTLGDPENTSYNTGIYLRTGGLAYVSTGSAAGTLALNPTGNGPVVINNTSASTGAKFDVSGNTGGVKMCLSGYSAARRWYLNMDSAGFGIHFNTNAEQIKFNENGTVTIASLAGSGSRTVVADANGTLSASSDIRLKTLVKTDLPGLAEVMKLQPRSYKWKSDIKKRGKDASVEVGFIANEVNKVIPSAAPMGADGYYGLYDRTLVAALVKATQEQQKVIELQKAWICKQSDAPEELCDQ